MRSTQQYQPSPGRTAQILRESAVVAKAIARHRREAALQARIDEVHQMEALHSGVFKVALALTRPHQPVADAA